MKMSGDRCVVRLARMIFIINIYIYRRKIPSSFSLLFFPLHQIYELISSFDCLGRRPEAVYGRFGMRVLHQNQRVFEVTLSGHVCQLVFLVGVPLLKHVSKAVVLMVDRAHAHVREPLVASLLGMGLINKRFIKGYYKSY